MFTSTNYQHRPNLIDQQKSMKAGRPASHTFDTINKMASFLLTEITTAGKHILEKDWNNTERVARASRAGVEMVSRQVFKRHLKHYITCSALSEEKRATVAAIYSKIVKSKNKKAFPANATCDACHDKKEPAKREAPNRSLSGENSEISFDPTSFFYENSPDDEISEVIYENDSEDMVVSGESSLDVISLESAEMPFYKHTFTAEEMDALNSLLTLPTVPFFT